MPSFIPSPWCVFPDNSPCRAIRDLHLATCESLGVEAAVKSEVETLLNNLQQLLIGICIMQVGKRMGAETDV